MSEIYYAIMDKKKLACFNCHLPIFWMMKVAKKHNEERLNGEGKIVKVLIERYVDFWNPKDRNKLISYIKTVVNALEKNQSMNLNGEDYTRGELSAFKRVIGWLEVAP